jgi:hypothetical protein
VGYGGLTCLHEVTLFEFNLNCLLLIFAKIFFFANVAAFLENKSVKNFQGVLIVVADSHQLEKIKESGRQHAGHSGCLGV